jgi:type I restriction enzyme S subunit
MEQRRIADFLDAETARVDRIYARQTAVLQKLDEHDRAVRDQLVDQLVCEVGEIPLRRWITRIEQGVSPQCEGVPRVGDDWGVLKLSAVKGGFFNGSENKRLPDHAKVRPEYEVRRGDLLVTRANTPALVGDAAVVNEEVKHLLLPDLIYRVGLVQGVDAEFVAQVVLSSRVRQLIEAVARGSSQSMVKIRGEDIKSWLVPAASLSQQKSLVREIMLGLQSTNRLKGAVRRSLAVLAERRQALITATVTGQLDISTASGRGVTDGVS